jgi:hypothetical protein
MIDNLEIIKKLLNFDKEGGFLKIEYLYIN